MKCVVELFGDDRNGRKMIAWGRRIGCVDAAMCSISTGARSPRGCSWTTSIRRSGLTSSNSSTIPSA